jgi:hypothetical protein
MAAPTYMADQPIVFISCGQFTEEEKRLGAEICGLVEKLTPFKPYFAEYQTSLEGLTKNILEALNHAVGLIAVLHPRGTVIYPNGDKHTRGSVWVEQEIAIAAFLSQIVGRKLHTAAFVHESVAREGMRDQLLLNPRKFKTNSDVLDHLGEILPGWSAKNIPSMEMAELIIKFSKIRCMQQRHDYELEIDIRNKRKERLEDYQVDVLFPDAFLNQTVTYGTKVYERRTNTHRFFRAGSRNGLYPIHPGDTLKVLTLPYYVDENIFHWWSDHLDDKVTATMYLYVPKQEPQTAEKTMKELQVF